MRSRRATLATLLALCALAAGVQTLVPTSAGAVANQLTDCEFNGIPGWGYDTNKNWCQLGAGEVIVVDPGPCPNPRACVTDQHNAPVDAGSDSDLRIGAGGRQAGPTVQAKPKKRETAKQRWERQDKEEEKERARRLATMSAAERQKIYLACLDISVRRQKLLDRQPENLGEIIVYFLGFQEKRAGIKTDWKYDRALERQLPIYGRWTEATKRLQEEEARAECWLVVDMPTKLPI